MEQTKVYKNMFVVFLFACLCGIATDIAVAEEKSTLETASDFVEEELYEPVTALVQTVWGFKLWTIDNRTVTVQKAIKALLIIIFGILIARALCWLLKKRLSAARRINENTASIIQKITFYFLVFFVLLFGLRVLSIPLTAFTFLGGALAIGVGFGTQAIMSNFISGFILMAERPIRVGDLIQIEDRFATVEEVGVRCTRIRTGDNVHILVPNSKFLDQSIVNWTLSDRQVRVQITVGVVYGSPVREVEKLLLEAADKHADVKRDPEPYVRFSDFGDNSLVFDLYFFISLINLYERKRISSDIRFHVDELFRNAGIVIAFPQRDVHLDTLKPLDIRIIEQQKSNRL
jgi:small-conductance mechanosensitive channel